MESGSIFPAHHLTLSFVPFQLLTQGVNGLKLTFLATLLKNLSHLLGRHAERDVRVILFVWVGPGYCHLISYAVLKKQATLLLTIQTACLVARCARNLAVQGNKGVETVVPRNHAIVARVPVLMTLNALEVSHVEMLEIVKLSTLKVLII